MKPHRICATAASTLLLVAALASPARADCDAQSGANRAALVELYTSEACSSCPPAEAQFQWLRHTLAPGANFVPLELHVSYWDGPGWTDALAQKTFSDRQSWLVAANHHKTVYTPHYFVGDAEFVSHEDAELRSAVQRINAAPAPARIHLSAAPSAAGIHLRIEALSASPSTSQSLFAAIAQNGLASRVTGGENGGKHLRHEHVARAWVGPIPLVNGQVLMEGDLGLPAGADPAKIEVVAFVEDRERGEVLQAVGAGNCAVARKK